MKIKYTFADGTTSEIEVTQEVHEAKVALDKQEAASDRRYRRHTYSLDAIGFEGAAYGSEDAGIAAMFEDDNTSERLREAIAQLKPK